MSHHFLVPTNENGVSLDPDIGNDINEALQPPFAFQNVFLYSHGWWTDAIRAMQGYNRFTIEFSGLFRSQNALRDLPTLNIGIHWPSTLTEDQLSLLNYAEALSFFTMEKRADTVGENCGHALLKFILSGRPADASPLRIHLIGHSFGCKVVCKALQQIADDSANEPLPGNIEWNVVLLQAAFDNDELEPQKDYGGIAGLDGLRLLITRSAGDRALSDLYPKAHRLAHLFGNVQPALGNSGPTDGGDEPFKGKREIQIGPDYDPTAADPLTDHLIVADLTALHAAHSENNDPHSGHHSDVFHSEIYRLMAAFCFARL